jgi:hypothetical protein
MKLGSFALFVSTALASLVGTSRARAEPTARLAYVVTAPSCPDETSFRALVTARLGRDPFTPVSEDQADVGVRRDGAGLSGRVVVRRSGKVAAERSIRASAGECDTLVEALAAVAALAIDPDAALRPSERLPELPPSTPPPAATMTPVKPPPEVVEYRPLRPEEPPTRVSFAARGAIVGSIGVLPAGSMGGELGIGFGIGKFSLFAEGRAETKVATAGGSPSSRIDGTLLTAGIAPCGRVGVLIGCLVGRVGALRGRSPDAAHPRDDSTMVAYIGPRLALHLPIDDSFAITPQLEMVVPLVRTTLLFDQQPAWSAPSIAGALGLGVMYVSR